MLSDLGEGITVPNFASQVSSRQAVASCSLLLHSDNHILRPHVGSPHCKLSQLHLPPLRV